MGGHDLHLWCRKELCSVRIIMKEKKREKKQGNRPIGAADDGCFTVMPVVYANITSASRTMQGRGIIP